MLQEVFSAAPTLHHPRMLTPLPSLTAELPELESKISFLPFVSYLKDKLPKVSETTSKFFTQLIDNLERRPALLSPMNNLSSLEEQSELLEMLCTALFPVVSEHEKNSFALSVPYQFQIFHHSEPFARLFLDQTKEHLLLPENLASDQLKNIECSMIYSHVLEKFYGIKLNDSPELVYPVSDANTGLKRYFKIKYDRRFIDVHLKGVLPPIHDCAVCLNTFRILDLEKQLQAMPLHLFEVEGFAVWVAEDVTTDESLETIKKILLRQKSCDMGIADELKEAIHALVGLNDIQIGLSPFLKVNNRYILDDTCSQNSLGGKQMLSNDPDSQAAFSMYVGFLSEHPEPITFSVLSEDLVRDIPLLKPVFDMGARSYIHYPMQNSDGLLGVLEIASPIPNLLTYEVMSRLEPAIPLLSVALLKSIDAFHQKIENLVKEKFTALQPSVDWKFAEVAWESLRNNDIGTPNVVFENVYPLYGAIDIRNSSMERSHAIQKDLKEHLVVIDEILNRLEEQVHLPLLEGLKFKIFTIQQTIQENMLTEDEVRINEFIENEVRPVLGHLQRMNPQLQKIVDDYFDMVQSPDSPLCRYRKEYEETLSIINETMLQFLDKEEDSVQKSYPHYFEKYRTDGVEYNIYIGQSIAPNYPFDLLYLKNIRLWQLRSMAEAARISHNLLPSLKLPLQTTQLILIQSQCISILFRRDERRFDVEGAYNIRYEIIKKRLDKVHIKDSTERLTQPGKIAIVYSNQKEVPEYQQYIEFLQNKNILQPGIEFLDLEELQGVNGLKAMRVAINLEK
ncbi:hypothetical protein OCK74_27480 [Chitinophagaceae bacterium LB-8]|uniref:GAF domain-containing protein n=1 Tax=Paraflavisolibacter caeni TaxID=2982496 RepID=A0A9X3BJI0_9BACT|nr:hypothetical protein [Paraflavisolibacter caeni]MCU7552892.1 hypothetical protein [Paraflavisolibacter caeni]